MRHTGGSAPAPTCLLSAATGRGTPNAEQGPPGLHQLKITTTTKKRKGNNSEEWGYCRKEQVGEVVWGQ